MAAKYKKPEEEVIPVTQAELNPLVITVSELAAMSEKEKQSFRSKGGTVTNNPN